VVNDLSYESHHEVEYEYVAVIANDQGILTCWIVPDRKMQWMNKVNVEDDVESDFDEFD
jgi:hypothetical protein